MHAASLDCQQSESGLRGWPDLVTQGDPRLGCSGLCQPQKSEFAPLLFL